MTTTCLLPFFRLSTGLGPVASPPPRARTRDPSIVARLQSIPPAHSNSDSSRAWSFGQTPAAVQYAIRRQQVIPEPQPISRGRSSQLIPVLSTKRTPVRQSRSSIRFRPGRSGRFGCGGGGGNGPMRSHNASGSRGLAMASVLKFEVLNAYVPQPSGQLC